MWSLRIRWLSVSDASTTTAADILGVLVPCPILISSRFIYWTYCTYWTDIGTADSSQKSIVIQPKKNSTADIPFAAFPPPTLASSLLFGYSPSVRCVRARPIGSNLRANLDTRSINPYHLVKSYNASNFFNDFSFFTAPDPTHGAKP